MGLENVTAVATTAVDFEKFRLRRFVEHLDRIGELERKVGATSARCMRCSGSSICRMVRPITIPITPS